MVLERVEDVPCNDPAVEALRQAHAADLVGRSMYSAAEVTAMTSGQARASWAAGGVDARWCFAGYVNGATVAGIDLWRRAGTNGKQWVVDNFVVDSGWRRRGVGRELFWIATERLRDEHARLVVVYAMQHEADAVAFWTKVFNRPPDHHDGQITVEGTPYPAVGWEHQIQ